MRCRARGIGVDNKYDGGNAYSDAIGGFWLGALAFAFGAAGYVMDLSFLWFLSGFAAALSFGALALAFGFLKDGR